MQRKTETCPACYFLEQTEGITAEAYKSKRKTLERADLESSILRLSVPV